MKFETFKSSSDYGYYLRHRNDLLYVRNALRELNNYEEKLSDDLLEAISETCHSINQVGLYVAIPSDRRVKIKYNMLLDVFRKQLCLEPPSYFNKKYQSFSKNFAVLKFPSQNNGNFDVDFELCSYGGCPIFGVSTNHLETIKRSRLVRKLYGERFLDCIFSAIKLFSDKIEYHNSYLFFGSDRVVLRQFFDVDCGYKDFTVEISEQIDRAIEVDAHGDF